MYFETIIQILQADYEMKSLQHIIDKDRPVVEKKLTYNPYKNLESKAPILINDRSKLIENKTNKDINKLQQFNFKYKNAFFTSLSREQEKILQKKIIAKFKNDGFKHLVLHTYTNDNNIAIARLEKIYNFLPPNLRVNTIYKQDLCYKGNPCNTTNIKLIY